MSKILKLLILLLLFSKTPLYASGFSTIDSLKKDSANFVLKELRYGRVKAERVASIVNSNSPTGTSGVMRNYIYTEITDTIPAKLNVNFGVELIMESKQDFLIVPLTVVWKFPSQITNLSNKSFHQVSRTSNVYTNRILNYSYKFDQDYEVKPGIWELEIYHNNKLLYSRQFYLMFEI